jgi:cytochrome b561
MSNQAIRTTARHHYDRISIAFHWLTAILVVTLFALAETWGFLAKGTPLRSALQSFHISLGILLAAVVIGRIVWRCMRRGQMAPATTGVQEVAAKTVHMLLYVLLCTQVTLGFLFRWSQGTEPFRFFGLFSIPHVVVDPAWRSTIGGLHNNVAWAIILLAGLHAFAALAHYFVLKDRVLGRMLPAKN